VDPTAAERQMSPPNDIEEQGLYISRSRPAQISRERHSFKSMRADLEAHSVRRGNPPDGQKEALAFGSMSPRHA
jgi:hypothetical protein